MAEAFHGADYFGDFLSLRRRRNRIRAMGRHLCSPLGAGADYVDVDAIFLLRSITHWTNGGSVRVENGVGNYRREHRTDACFLRWIGIAWSTRYQLDYRRVPSCRLRVGVD